MEEKREVTKRYDEVTYIEPININDAFKELGQYGDKRLQADIINQENERRHRMIVERHRLAFAFAVVVVVGAFTGAFLFGEWDILKYLATLSIGFLGGFGYAKQQSHTQSQTPPSA